MTPTDTPAVTLRSATLRQGSFTLGPLSESLPHGTTALLGANGAGKSTLMRLLVSLAQPSAGSVEWHAGSDSSASARAAQVGYLPQDFTPPPRVRADDFLHYVAWCKGADRSGLPRGAMVQQALDAVGLADKGRARCGQLSGGMQRRLGIASALVGDPRAVVLDEPTVGLDPRQGQGMRDLFTEIASRRPVIISTHMCEDVAAVATHVIILDEGHIRFSGRPEDLVAPGEPVASSTIEHAFTRILEQAPQT